jgi:hypothetical protein
MSIVVGCTCSIAACTDGSAGEDRPTAAGIGTSRNTIGVVADDPECRFFEERPGFGPFSSVTHEGGSNGTVDLGDGETATISNSDGIKFDWSATIPISHIFVRGTPTVASVPFYDPPAQSGTRLSAPVDTENGGMQTELTTIKFCFLPHQDKPDAGGGGGDEKGGGGKSW